MILPNDPLSRAVRRVEILRILIARLDALAQPR
jgi:hypothetical protein